MKSSRELLQLKIFLWGHCLSWRTRPCIVLSTWGTCKWFDDTLQGAADLVLSIMIETKHIKLESGERLLVKISCRFNDVSWLSCFSLLCTYCLSCSLCLCFVHVSLGTVWVWARKRWNRNFMIIYPHWNIGQRNTSAPQHRKPSASKCVYAHSHTQWIFLNKSSSALISVINVISVKNKACDTEDVLYKV